MPYVVRGNIDCIMGSSVVVTIEHEIDTVDPEFLREADNVFAVIVPLHMLLEYF